MSALEYRATFKCACGKGIGLHTGQGDMTHLWFIQVIHKSEYVARAYIEDPTVEESAKYLIKKTNESFDRDTFWSGCKWVTKT